MGGGTRNHGGTRGHGCFPLPGEKANLNLHILSDRKLFKVINCSEKIKEKQTSNQKLMLVKMLPQIRNGGTLERVSNKFLEEEFKNTEYKYKQTKDTTNVKGLNDDSSGDLNPHSGSKKCKVGQNPSGKPPKSQQDKSFKVGHNMTEDTDETVSNLS